MKFYVTNFGKGNVIDNNISHMLSFIPEYSNHVLVDNVKEADIILMVHLYQSDYVFQSLDIGTKPIVVLDYMETECIINNPYFLPFSPISIITNIAEYAKLQKWLEHKQSQIKIYFKREFFIDGPQIPVLTYPIDFVGIHPFYWKDTATTMEDFLNRKCFISFVWGLSNTSRPILHGEMMKRYGGERLCLDEQMFKENNNHEKITLLYKPWYMRMPFDEMMKIYGQSKISIALWGAGRKCFRDTESSFNSVIAFQETDYHYSYPWIHGINCIFLPNKKLDNGYLQIDEEKAIGVLNDYLHRHEELYNIYLAGKKNCLNYRIDNYLVKYLIPKLERIHDL